MIVLNDVSKIYATSEGAEALKDVTLKIEAGECFGIAGKSGEGKSTLLRIMNGLEVPTKGEVIIDGVNINTMPESELRDLRQSIGFVFQSHALVSNMTVRENILLPLRFSKNNTHDSLELVAQFVGVLDKLDRYPSQLSLGQRQRVSIARALIMQPKILLCDEITASLDDTTTLEILEVIRNIIDQYHTTVVFVSHKINDIRYLADRVAVLSHNSIETVLPNPSKGLYRVHSETYTEYVRDILAGDGYE